MGRNRSYDFEDSSTEPRSTRGLQAAALVKVAGWAMPWIGVLVLLPVGAVARWQWGGEATISSALTLATVMVAVLTWKVAGQHGVIERVHTTVSFGGAVAWITLVVATGFHEVQVNTLMIVGGLTAFCWNLRHSRAGRTDTSSGGGDLWSRMIAPMAGLDGSRLQVNQATDEHAQGDLHLPRGQMTAATAAGSAEQVASVMGLPPNGVRISPNPQDAGMANIAFTRRDLLTVERRWSFPDHIGASVADAPILLGRYEDGQPVLFDPLSGEDKDLTHLLIAGMTGSGKSVGARVITSDLLLRRDIAVVAADIVKGRQTLGPLADAVDWFADTEAEARELLAAVQRAVPVRASYLADQGLDKWQPGCGLSLLVVWIEEAPALIADDQAFADLTKQVRSAGIMLIVSVQRATYTNLPTDARSMLGSVLCFGVKTSADASFALDDLTEQGARPELWKDQKKGYAYLSASGIPVERHTMPLRTDRIYAEDLEQVAAWDGREPLDETTAKAFGAAYTDRHRDRTQASSSASPAEPASDLEPAEPLGDEAEEDTAIEDLKARVEALPETFEPPKARVTFGAPPKVSTEEARAILRTAIDEIADDGRDTLAPRELHEAVAEAGRSRPWMFGQLGELVDEGRLARLHDGTYRIRMLEGADA